MSGVFVGGVGVEASGLLGGLRLTVVKNRKICDFCLVGFDR